jgi:protein-disulfide isomerase
MSKFAKPLTIIVLAVVVAGGAGLFLARRSPSNEPSSAGTLSAAPTGDGRLKGPDNAPVTLIEFGDYQCPTCARFHPIVEEMIRRYPSQLRLEFHHYPLISIHPNSMAAALAAEAAGDQGKFWEMHDSIFRNQETWSKVPNAESEFLTYASKLGLNVNQFMQSMRSPETQQRVLRDVTQARDANLDSVPTFFVNGKKIGLPNGPDEFSRIIQENLPK